MPSEGSQFEAAGDVGEAYRNLEAQKEPIEAVLDYLHTAAEQHEDTDNFRYYTVSQVENFLQWAVGQGIIMHGTTLKLTELQPRQANDSAKESGNRLAVYMADTPAMAMFSALTGGVEINGWRSSHIQTTREKGKLPRTNVQFAVEREDHVQDEGFVYIFPKTASDEYSDNEYKAYHPIRPLAVLKITLADFKYPIEKI